MTLEEKGQSREDNEDIRLLISGEEFTFKKGDEVLYKGKWKFDPSKDPKWIDLEIAEGKKTGTSLGIYALDKDSLKLCLGPTDAADRPTEFAAPDGKKYVFITFKREKN